MDRLIHPGKQERNLEKDLTEFFEAIKDVRIAEIDADFDERAALDLVSELSATKLFLLGETHGVKENPAIIYTLFKKFGFKNLALEWGPTLKDAVERYVNGEAFDFDAIKDSPDGRVTAGHFALLRKLKEEGLLERFTCFDRGGSSWDERDECMAHALVEHLADTPTLAVAGNLHTKTEPVALENAEGEHHPMGERIKKEIPNLPSGRITYLAGEFRNFGIRNFGDASGGTGSLTARFFRDESGRYIFELPEAHAATVPYPGASLP